MFRLTKSFTKVVPSLKHARFLSSRSRGTVKFFDKQKGWGYIACDGSQKLDVHVHWSNIAVTVAGSNDNFRSLADGEEVEFEVAENERGYFAKEVTGPDGDQVIGAANDGMMH